MTLRRVAAATADPREYLAGANAAFGRWGDEALFRWAFRDDAELMFVDDVAGCGITHRLLRNGQRVSIMTGAWALPDARRRGAFTRMVEAISADAQFVGFVRAENASARVLDRLGAAMHPAFYCRWTGPTNAAAALDTIDPDPARFRSTFAYTPQQWRAQFLERPDAQIECVGRAGAWTAVVERADFDRVHAVSDDAALPTLAARAHAAGRRLFWYTTRRPVIECEWTAGYVGTLPPAVIDWDLQNGDRM